MKNIYKIRLLITVIVFILIVLGFTCNFYPVKLLDLQLAPVLQRVFVDFSIISLVILVGIIVTTILFGRIYCSVICPFGILQDFAGLILKRKNKFVRNFSAKYFIAALTFGALVGGSVVLLRYIEPYTLFGSALTLSVLGLIAAVAVIILVFFKNRFFCTNICPVGALLGLISKISLNKIYINQLSCVSCGMCERNCPSGCINSKEKSVDNETCVKCLKCLSVCPKNGIKIGKEQKNNDAKFSLKRRQLIIGTAVVALFGGMVKAGMVLKDKVVEKIKDVILPAGAVSKERFLNECFNCNLCVANCPNKILVKADETFGAVHIDYSKGYCKYDCTKCGEVCPTGAIKRLKLEEKQKTRIAMAMVKQDECAKCGLCAKECPASAIIKEDGETAIINASKCIGCGACKNVCPHKAIEVFSIKEQKSI